MSTESDSAIAQFYEQRCVLPIQSWRFLMLTCFSLGTNSVISNYMGFVGISELRFTSRQLRPKFSI